MTWLIELAGEFISEILGALVELVIKMIKALFRKIGDAIGALFRWVFRRDRSAGRHASPPVEPSRR
jgi:hypothetical protein